MKKILIIIISAVLSSITIAGNVSAYFLYSTFNTPENSPYVETYLSVIGKSVVFTKNANGKFQGIIEVSMLFKQGENIKAAKKYNLLSPEINDTLGAFPNFIDQQRVMLPNGSYNLEISISDLNKPGKPFTGKEEISLNYSKDSVNLSDIQLIESFSKSSAQTVLTKNGYDLIPYVSTYFPASLEKINFYAEIYNSDKALGNQEKFVLNYFIEGFETKAKMNSYSNFSKQVAGNVNPFIGSFSIKDLPSGNYSLVMEVKDKTNKLVTSKKIFFQRNNPKTQFDLNDIAAIDVSNTFVKRINDRDSLLDYIKSLRPISNSLEVSFSENQVKGKDIALMQQYFYNFWQNRNSENPENAWLTYNRQVKKANKMFGTKILKGYNTDRGRVFLKYGAPDTRTESSYEPSAYPYEIWQYNRLSTELKSQTNKKFVFYNPDLVTNDYQLIHSDAQGEPYDANWQIRINKRMSQSRDMEQKTAPDHYGSQSIDQFNNPR